MTSTSASDLHPDVLELVQKISDEVEVLVSNVETLDGNKWLDSADKIDALNSQLQAMLVKKPDEPASSSKSTKS